MKIRIIPDEIKILFEMILFPDIFYYFSYAINCKLFLRKIQIDLFLGLKIRICRLFRTVSIKLY